LWLGCEAPLLLDARENLWKKCSCLKRGFICPIGRHALPLLCFKKYNHHKILRERENMFNQNSLIDWLLEDNNPAVKYRTLTELLGKSRTDSEARKVREVVLKTLPQAVDTTWMMSTKGMLVTYNLLALAECGLTKKDIDVSAIFNQWLQKPGTERLYTSTWWPSSVNWKPKFQFEAPPSTSSLTGGGSYHPGGWFDGACGDALLLRALVSLGYNAHSIVRGWLDAFSKSILPDGGFLCLHLRPVFKYTPKSCMKANLNVLLMLAECKKHGLEFECSDKLLISDN
jgi:hypothetical protein